MLAACHSFKERIPTRTRQLQDAQAQHVLNYMRHSLHTIGLSIFIASSTQGGGGWMST